MKISMPPPTGNNAFDRWMTLLIKELRSTSQIDAQYVHINTVSTLGKEALTITQDDADQPFIKLDGTVAANGSTNIDTVAPSGTARYWLVDIEGADYWVLATQYT